MKILLKGYYNAGNIGDDLLMISSYHIIKELLPGSELYIGYNTNTNNYISKLLPDSKIINLKNSKLDKFDLTVYGGGGLFFGFKTNSLLWFILNFLFKYFNFNLLKNKIKPIISTEQTIGIGIGFGPYKSCSSNYIRHMLTARQFLFLSVRDESSYQIVKNHNKLVKKHTDLVFNPSLKKLFYKKKDILEKDKFIGIIFRDWPFYDNKLSELIKLYHKLQSNGKKVKFISVNPNNDIQSINILKENNISVLKYKPEKILKFIEEISKAEWIISQRAHGMIISSLLNIPSIGIELEPKIKNVHKMLPNATKIVELNKINTIPELLSFPPFIKDIKQDVLNNGKIIINLKKDLNLFFKKLN